MWSPPCRPGRRIGLRSRCRTPRPLQTARQPAVVPDLGRGGRWCFRRGGWSRRGGVRGGRRCGWWRCWGGGGGGWGGWGGGGGAVAALVAAVLGVPAPGWWARQVAAAYRRGVAACWLRRGGTFGTSTTEGGQRR